MNVKPGCAARPFFGDARREARFGGLTLPGAAPPRWLCLDADMLRDRFRENLPLGRVAGAAGVHPAYLARVFRRHFRCSPGEYVRQLRVEHACREIARDDAPLAAIALEAGFADQSHLSRVFKRHSGMTPGAFRELSRTR